MSKRVKKHTRVKNKNKINKDNRERYNTDLKYKKRINENNLKYRRKNKDKINAKNRKTRKENKEKYNIYVREYRVKNHERVLKNQRDWILKNIKKVRLYKKKYRDRNKKRALEYCKTKRKNDIVFKLKGNLRHRINMALRGACKSKGTMELIGCDILKLKRHLESKFLENMSWENYGLYGWHVDHIIPCDYFNLSLPEEQKKCFNYANLQPLWAMDNLKKSSKIL